MLWWRQLFLEPWRGHAIRAWVHLSGHAANLRISKRKTALLRADLLTRNVAPPRRLRRLPPGPHREHRNRKMQARCSLARCCSRGKHSQEDASDSSAQLATLRATSGTSAFNADATFLMDFCMCIQNIRTSSPKPIARCRAGNVSAQSRRDSQFVLKHGLASLLLCFGRV